MRLYLISHYSIYILGSTNLDRGFEDDTERSS
ncbi:hypothetical protein WI0192307A01_CDS0031 [Salmonella phage VT223]